MKPYWRNETIAASDHACNVVGARLTVAKQFTKSRDMDSEIGLDDNRVRPRIFNQLFLAHDFAGAFHQSSQDIEGATPDANRRIALQQQTLSRKESERAKGQHVRGTRVRPWWHSTLLYTDLPLNMARTKSRQANRLKHMKKAARLHMPRSCCSATGIFTNLLTPRRRPA